MTNSSVRRSGLANSTGKRVRTKAVEVPAHEMKKLDTVIASPRALASLYAAKVREAYKNRQIFSVFGGYGTIKKSLLQRGWLEKLPLGRYKKLQNLPVDVLVTNAKPGNVYEKVAISKMMNHLPAFFVWQAREQQDMYLDVHPYRNRIRIGYNVDFATKVGLIGCAEQQHWFRQEGIAGMIYPRFFRLGINQEERMAFINEYRVTQCCSLLRFLIQSFDKYWAVIDYENGAVCPTIMNFALDQAKQQLDDWNNCDSLDIEQSEIPEEDWSRFLDDASRVINNNQKIKCTYDELKELVQSSNDIIKKMEKIHPDLKWDGCKNLWILKPGYLNRGRGIVIRNNLNDILQWCTTYSDNYYIVQKYIEKPLLIYRTKFDIRQYMLISIRESTVQIWLYTDCYLRFSSQEYTTDDFNESIHLTNNCVQKNYKNKEDRDVRLPENNMWSLEEFKAYLRTQKLPDDIWERQIFAGFKENIIAAVLPSLDEASLYENAFELFGCDFMLDEQYNPILIEINSTPDLTPSTNVTARICPMVMEDCLKVIVDFPRNSLASTGFFTMIYEVNYKSIQNSKDMEGLNINGKAVQFFKSAPPPEQPKVSKKPKIQKNNFFKNISGKKVSEILSNNSKTSTQNAKLKR